MNTHLLQQAEAEVALIEVFIRDQLRSDLPLMRELCEYAFDAGGKRLRPGLTLLSGRLLGASRETLFPAAAAVEMIHTATLLHDDIMDASPLRRGRETVCRRWDAVKAVYAGDYILSKAFTLLSGYNRSDVLELFSEVTSRLCAGETLQARNRQNLGITLDDYLEIIDCKTALFLSSCCRVGGLLASASDTELNALTEYGSQIGRAFQITDDLLDYLGDSEQTGKDVGADFREGKFTLPVILALRGRDETADRLHALLASSSATDETFREVRRIVIESGAVNRTHDYAVHCTRNAIQSLRVLPSRPERTTLEELARWISNRTE
ncbi:MAG: polyprenyl synthetase family protein [Armatimonadetes bacterium]|jgi:octaprenyl-diphosphate synthase|nr:polyprenyl synthetase family protein [Armatimonadota bacterium]